MKRNSDSSVVVKIGSASAAPPDAVLGNGCTARAHTWPCAVADGIAAARRRAVLCLRCRGEAAEHVKRACVPGGRARLVTLPA